MINFKHKMNINNLLFKINDKLLFHLDYTGERVVPSEMDNDVPTLTQHLSRYVFALKYCANKHVLDIACGTGYGMSMISFIAKSICGIDIDSPTLIWANRNNKFFCPTKFIKKDVDIDTINGKFDTIICFETIEHLRNPIKSITKILKLLNKKGVLIFSIPLNDSPNKFHKHHFDWNKVKKMKLKIRIKWYCQIDNNIIEGQNKNAKFAIGIINNEN